MLIAQIIEAFRKKKPHFLDINQKNVVYKFYITEILQEKPYNIIIKG